MRVFINAASANLGGALTYIKSLLGEFSASANGDRFTVVVPADTLGQLERTVDRQTVTLLAYPHSSGGMARRVAFDNWTVPRLLRQHKADVLFSSTGFATLRAPCPQLLLVRNALYFCPVYRKRQAACGESYRPVRTRRWMSLLSIRGSDAVLFPTDAMRAMVERHVPLARKPTRVLHYGFAPETFFRGNAPVPKIVEQMQAWRSDGYQIVLNVSHYAIHKNFETLIEALPAVVASGLKIKCVCTISEKLLENSSLYARAYDALVRRAQELGLGDVLVCAGHFEHAQLNYLYRSADLFVFPSFTESFGHPLVEAMACGVPIVASAMPANQELCGEAAAYFDTFSPASCAKVLEATLTSTAQRNAMSASGLKRSQTFSWSGYAASLMDVLREVARSY